MARISVYLPDNLHRQAKRARLNVSVLTQQAIRDALARGARMRALEDFLRGDADGPPVLSREEIAAADAWAAAVLAAAERGRGARRSPRSQRTKRTA